MWATVYTIRESGYCRCMSATFDTKERAVKAAEDEIRGGHTSRVYLCEVVATVESNPTWKLATEVC